MNELLFSAGRWGEWWADNLWRATWQGAIVLAVVWGVARRHLSFATGRVLDVEIGVHQVARRAGVGRAGPHSCLPYRAASYGAGATRGNWRG